VPLKERAKVVICVLRHANVMMLMWRPSHWFPSTPTFFGESCADTAKASCSSFNLSELLNEIFAVRATISAFWGAVVLLQSQTAFFKI
jgi:hypothetical protein